VGLHKIAGAKDTRGETADTDYEKKKIESLFKQMEEGRKLCQGGGVRNTIVRTKGKNFSDLDGVSRG